LQLQMGGLQLGNAQREREQEEAATLESRRALETELKGSIGKAQELADLNDELEGTVLETGQPFGDVYRSVISGGAPIVEALGFDATSARELASKFQRLKKLSTSFTLGLIDQLKINGVTDSKLEALRDATMNVGTSPGANRLAIADALKLALDTADIKGIDLEGREEAEALLHRLKGRGVDEADEPILDVPAAGRAVSDAARRVIKFADLPD
jgi:hypothetical protein